MNGIDENIKRVKDQLKPLGKIVVAFSGGKDSFFLLKIAVETLGKENVFAFFVTSGFTTGNDKKRVEYFTRQLDFNMKTISVDLSGEKEIMKNPKERCYYCKRKIFETLKKEALEINIDIVADGSTYSDLDEYRPGMKAIEELKVISPLQDAKITSPEIIAYLGENYNIEDYYLTSSTCLATRFPYDFDLNESLLEKFDQVETFFVEQGFYPVKIRYIPDGIRVETATDNFAEILGNKKKIIDFCKKRGLRFVTLDLEGIKSGVWD